MFPWDDQGSLAPALAPGLFAVRSRGFDLDQVERAFKPPSAYDCMYVRGGSFGLPLLGCRALLVAPFEPIPHGEPRLMP